MRFALLVPGPDYPDPWRWAFDSEAGALERHGATVDPVPWTDVGNLAGYDLILPLVVWGYHLRYGEWLALLDRAEQAGMPFANSPSLLRWNSDKAYLAELEAKNIPSVPTVEVASLGESDLAEAAKRFGTDDLVIKPPVSAYATGTHRMLVGDPIPLAGRGERMMIQPFLPAISSEGEYALILFDGVLSHTLVKRPKPGDFRTQPTLGGSIEPGDTPADAEELAQAVLAAAPALPTYARVDMVRDPDGQFRIMELELIEPALWLDVAPHAEKAFAQAVFAAAERLPKKPLP